MGEKKYAAAGATTHKSMSFDSAKVMNNMEVCKCYTKFNVSTWQTNILL